VLLAIRELAIDVARDLDHVARDVLMWILVAGAILHVAEIAVHTQRHGIDVHNPGAQVLGLQQLQVLGAATALRRRGANRNQTQQRKQQYTHIGDMIPQAALFVPAALGTNCGAANPGGSRLLAGTRMAGRLGRAPKEPPKGGCGQIARPTT